MAELLRGGVTTVMEIGSFGEYVVERAPHYGLRVYMGQAFRSGRWLTRDGKRVEWEWSNSFRPRPIASSEDERRSGDVTRYVVRRLLQTVSVVFGISLLAFAVMHVVLGDPVRLIAGPDTPESVVARVRAELGLERPLHVQYRSFLGRGTLSAMTIKYPSPFTCRRT